MRHHCHLVAASVTCLLFALWPLAGLAQEQDWNREFWDPAAPAPGQIDLPLPCNGRIAFVEVVTPVVVGTALSDRSVWLGSPDEERGYIENFRKSYLRGGFTGEGRTFYYLAKYELTRDQWAAVMDPECPVPSRGGMRPFGGASWFDAIAFTRRYSEWLLAADADELPREDGVAGYVRLPTEEEWEYAARGGGAVADEIAFRSKLPPMEGDIGDFAWFEGRGSANGTYRPIGLKKANPLGLHGMYGGVEEIALEPFRLNHLGRQHGQAGGFVTRGGSIETPRSELRSSARSEWFFFNRSDGKATALDRFGIRLVISVAVNTSISRSQLLRDLWIEAAGTDPDEEVAPLAMLDELAERETDKRLLSELAFLRNVLVTNEREREEALANQLRLTMQSGIGFMHWLSEQKKRIDLYKTVIGIRESNLAKLTPGSSDFLQAQNAIDDLKLKLDAAQRSDELAFSSYLSVLVDVADGFSAEEVDAQANRLAVELGERGQGRLVRGLTKLVDNVARYRDDPAVPREELYADAIR